jgi:hypothetical protein
MSGTGLKWSRALAAELLGRTHTGAAVQADARERVGAFTAELLPGWIRSMAGGACYCRHNAVIVPPSLVERRRPY